jgi:hypothetical protein
MVKVALFARLEARPGKEKEIESFLLGGLPLVMVFADRRARDGGVTFLGVRA